MKHRMPGLIYTHDEDLKRRLQAYVDGNVHLHTTEDPGDVMLRLDQDSPLLLMLDTRSPRALDLLSEAAESSTPVVSLAFGTPHSTPLRLALKAGAFATECLTMERNLFQALVDRAVDHLRLKERLRLLENRPPPPPPIPGPAPVPPSLAPIRRAWRHIQDPDGLVEALIDAVVQALPTQRAGLFLRSPCGESAYRFRFGLQCLAGSENLVYGTEDPLPQWMARQAHLITRAHAEEHASPREQSLLCQALDALGAEIIVPLAARGGLLGWLFLGHRLTGEPYRSSELQTLADLASYGSDALEHAFLHEDVTRQRGLVSAMLDALPVGVCSMDDQGCFTWLSQSMLDMLPSAPRALVGQPVERADPQLAQALRQALLDPDAVEHTWTLPLEGRRLAAKIHPMNQGGAVALLYDITDKCRTSAHRQENERRAFWSELAAGIAHEIRNPLVSIKTFAQLLPDRYQDEDFREQFARLIPDEIGRLDHTIDHIEAFAEPLPEDKVFFPLRGAVRKAVRKVLPTEEAKAACPVSLDFPESLPFVFGHEETITDMLTRLITNAVEALRDAPSPKLELHARVYPEGVHAHTMQLTIDDNGPGVAVEDAETCFSPFYTTKSKGFGLGLPFARRVMVLHNGDIELIPSDFGTTVRLSWPLHPREEAP